MEEKIANKILQIKDHIAELEQLTGIGKPISIDLKQEELQNDSIIMPNEDIIHIIQDQA